MYILSPILLVIFKNLLKATKHFHKKVQNSGSRLFYFSKDVSRVLHIRKIDYRSSKRVDYGLIREYS